MSEQQKTKKTNTRHAIRVKYSVGNVISVQGQFGLPKSVTVKLEDWKTKTPEGLSRFLIDTVPDWKHLILEKHVQIIDTKKKDGSQVVSEKDCVLPIYYLDSCVSMDVKTDHALKKNGKIPTNICDFMRIEETSNER